MFVNDRGDFDSQGGKDKSYKQGDKYSRFPEPFSG